MKKIIVLLGVCILYTAFFTPTSAFSAQNPTTKTVTIALCEWKPYTSELFENGGILADIVRKAFQKAGYSPVFEFLPWQRAKQKFLSGHADVLLGIYKTPLSIERYWLSQPLLKTDIVFARLASRQIQYNSLYDVADYSIGYVKDSGYDERLRQEGVTNTQMAPHESQNIQKLLAGRIDLIVDARDTLKRLLNTLPAKKRKQVVIMSPPIKRRSLHAAFAKTIDGKELQEIFNHGLSKIQSSGLYKRLLLENGFAPQE